MEITFLDGDENANDWISVETTNEYDEPLSLTILCALRRDSDDTCLRGFTTIDVIEVKGPDDNQYPLSSDELEKIKESIIEYYDEYGAN